MSKPKDGTVKKETARARLHEIELELKGIDQRTKRLEVEVTQILAALGVAAGDMHSDVFDFVYNEPHDHKVLIKGVGL